MQATNQRVQAGHTGQPHRVPHDVHRAAVTTARQYDKPLAPNMDDECLVIEHQWIVPPLLAVPRLMRWRHPLLELSGAIDLAGDEDSAVDKQRRLPSLDDFETLPVQRPLTERRHVERVDARHGKSAASPDEWVHCHRQPATASD